MQGYIGLWSSWVSRGGKSREASSGEDQDGRENKEEGGREIEDGEGGPFYTPIFGDKSFRSVLFPSSFSSSSSSSSSAGRTNMFFPSLFFPFRAGLGGSRTRRRLPPPYLPCSGARGGGQRNDLIRLSHTPSHPRAFSSFRGALLRSPPSGSLLRDSLSRPSARPAQRRGGGGLRSRGFAGQGPALGSAVPPGPMRRDALDLFAGHRDVVVCISQPAWVDGRRGVRRGQREGTQARRTRHGALAALPWIWSVGFSLHV